MTIVAADGGIAALAAVEGASGGHRTLAERAFTTLHEAIVTGLIAPGERLPIEDLARVLGMSPMPVREALRHLHEGGLVENVPHRGARVTELSVEDLQEIYDARLALEPLLVRKAAERFTDADAEGAQLALDRHVSAYRNGTRSEIFAAHTEFHFAIYRASRSRWLLRLVTPLWESSERYRLALPPRYRRRLQERRKEHEQILAACIAHEPDRAAAELHNHLSETVNRVAKRLAGDGGEA